jgi:hypothetical protein
MVNSSDIFNQLTDDTVTAWLSDSSMSKIVFGRLSTISKSPKGITLYLTSRRTVSWRMSDKIANEVLSQYRSNNDL